VHTLLDRLEYQLAQYIPGICLEAPFGGYLSQSAVALLPCQRRRATGQGRDDWIWGVAHQQRQSRERLPASAVGLWRYLGESPKKGLTNPSVRQR